MLITLHVHKMVLLQLCVCQDGEICCLKDGGVAAESRADIERENAILLTPHDVTDDNDPFHDLDLSSDEEQQEENEILVEDC